MGASLKMLVHPVNIKCDDDYVLKGDEIVLEGNNEPKGILIINSATGVSRKLYLNYALYMAEKGFVVFLYDYRGIGGSRPASLKGFEATFYCWGAKDLTAVLRYAMKKYRNCKLHVLGHSIGGTIVGMSNYCDSIFAMIHLGAQTAYHKDWKKDRFKLYFLWHVFFPFMTSIFGYFPGRILGLLEDLPKGVVQQWNLRRKHPEMVDQLKQEGRQVFYSKFSGRLLTLQISDDPIGTAVAVRRVHTLFINAKKNVKRINPGDIGHHKIGHFGFFSRKFKDTLWKDTADWFLTASQQSVNDMNRTFNT